jgi:hypothetical protein
MNAAIRIRPFAETDETAVIALWREAFPYDPPHRDPAHDIRRKTAYQPELFFVAELDRAVVGTAMAGYDGQRGWVYLVAVSGDHRRRGIGRALMRHVEDTLSSLGCPKLNLQIRGDNAEVVSFYQSLGYQIEERTSMGKLLITDHTTGDRLTTPETSAATLTELVRMLRKLRVVIDESALLDDDAWDRRVIATKQEIDDLLNRRRFDHP